LPVDPDGRVSLEEAHKVIDDKTLLVTVHGANNEIGTIQPIKELAELARTHGALFHCDAAQAVGKMLVDVNEWDVDLLSMSAHKFYGPKGVGALYIRGGTSSIPLQSIWYGGGQENGLRSGTMNVPGIVGFGEASEVCASVLFDEGKRVRLLRDQLEEGLLKKIPSLKINGCGAERLPNTSSLTFAGVDADALILNANQIMVGTGSACTSGTIEPSHVLTAIGLSRELAGSTIRISLGRFTSEEDIGIAVNVIRKAWQLMQ
jgi:cysteine desulfurase